MSNATTHGTFSTFAFAVLAIVAIFSNKASSEGAITSDGVPMRVVVSFAPTVQKFENVNLIVRLEDVTKEDRKHIVIAQQTRRQMTIGGGKTEPVIVPFKGLTIDPDARYNVRVIVDVHGDGKVSPGDFVTTERYMFEGSDAPKKFAVEIGPDALRRQ